MDEKENFRTKKIENTMKQTIPKFIESVIYDLKDKYPNNFFTSSGIAQIKCMPYARIGWIVMEAMNEKPDR